MRTQIAILAGGESQRMGQDKAALILGGLPLLERTARLALSAGTPVSVVGRVRPVNWPLPAVAFLEDAAPRVGPLGGLAAALHIASMPVLALACDLPLLTVDALQWVLAQSAVHNGEHGLVVVNHGQWEPLFSIYRPECLPLIESRLAAGKRSLHGLIEAGQFAFVDAPDWVCAQLLNVNTPEEWATIIRKVSV